MKSKLLLLLTGVAVGIVVSAAAWLIRRPARVEFINQLVADRQHLQTTQTLLEKRVAQLESDNRALKQTAAATPAPVKTPRRQSRAEGASPFAAFFGGAKNGTNSPGRAMEQLMKAGLQQQVEAKVSALKLRLKLTDLQETAIRERLQSQFDRAGEMATRMFQGKPSKDALQNVSADAQTTETAIRQLLTPEQLAEYDRYQQEERQTQSARVANLELLQMQSALQLTTEQQEQVYNILYDQTLKGLAAEGGNANRLSNWQQQLTARTDALRGVLTAEQFQVYEKQQAAQRQMVSSWMQSFSGNATNGGEDTSVQIEVTP